MRENYVQRRWLSRLLHAIPTYSFNLKFINHQTDSENPSTGTEWMEEAFKYIYDLKIGSDYGISKDENGEDGGR